MNSSENKSQYTVVNLIFLVLGLSLAGVVGAYWTVTLEPRLKKEFAAHADLLAQSQSQSLITALTRDDKTSARRSLVIAMDGVLLFSDPVTGEPFFSSVALELDYDVMGIEEGGLDIKRGEASCPDCFKSEIALISDETGELLGIAHFDVSGEFFKALRSDIFNKLLIAGTAMAVILAGVWMAVMGMVRKLNKEVAERTQAEIEVKESEIRFRQLANAAFEGIIVHEDGVIVDSNEAAAKLYGKGANELVGLSFGDLMPEHSLAMIEELIENDSAKPLELEIPCNDVFMNIEIRARRMERRGKAAQVVALRDISMQKKAEKELREAKDKAEEATKLKDKFMALVSHDLRSPLSGVMGVLELLVSEKYSIPEETRDEMLSESHRSLRALLDLIEDLLNVSRLRTGEIRPGKKMVDIRFLVELTLANLAPLAKNKNIEIEVDLPEGFIVLADPSMLGQVIQNLISNSIKFCGAGDKISVYQCEEIETGICVKDTGPGIDEKFLPNLFSHEVKTTRHGSSGERGTGFGLPMCMDLVKAHGGDIMVESEAGQGALFKVVMPEPCPLILLVDDQEVHRRSVITALDGDIALEYVEAENGLEALALLEAAIPMVVIVDLEMPVMDGFEFIRKVRENPLLDDMPIIVATSHRSAGHDSEKVTLLRQKVFALGANDFISKPIVAEDLIPRVRRYLFAQDTQYKY